ncbi:hypothetical protein BJ875DRAFT_457371 [Amylocarpus encephaloides]|uniref:C2H2-type domain-containing protein n=1 Tax=Amylocarpus encephaloides TaxID=45428 RepID=A0A9P7YM28_9HELO|nr:hypothetical protein BJ875DRAFT_457371 [Amylocarpus encephaloides]
MDGSKRKSENSGSGHHQRKTHKTSQQVDFPCDFDGCRSSFRCQFNLMRHKSSIHGSKRPCPLEGCNYASGRPDKMKEHIKRMHSFVSE